MWNILNTNMMLKSLDYRTFKILNFLIGCVQLIFVWSNAN